MNYRIYFTTFLIIQTKTNVPSYYRWHLKGRDIRMYGYRGAFKDQSRLYK